MKTYEKLNLICHLEEDIYSHPENRTVFFSPWCCVKTPVCCEQQPPDCYV